ncbi:MAG: exosome complex RNA-binding protein Rrp4 [Desulfurococcales archaeon]|nr:exosome complex RNA-binding protein Rrp4 [Desulfurococcales archaeon]
MGQTSSGGSSRTLVLPGDPVGEDVEARAPYIYVDDRGVKRAAVPGFVDDRGGKKVFVPLESIYIPKPGDIVIGMVHSVGVTNWFVDINSPYMAVLNLQDFLGRPFNPATDEPGRYLSAGDDIKAKVLAFDRTRNPLLTVQGEGLGKIVEGKIVEIAPARIPRVIGRKGSMLEVLSSETGCEIFAAVNGRVHVKCPNPEVEAIVILAIKTIEREAFTSGLTARIRKLIEEEKVVRGVGK